MSAHHLSLRLLAAAALFLLALGPSSADSVDTPTPAKGETINCPKRDGFLQGPVVPTDAVARDIYVAIVRALYPNSFHEFPDVFVVDRRNRWDIGQRKPSSVKYFRDKQGHEMEEVQGDVEVGSVQMSIEKCDGTVSMSLSR